MGILDITEVCFDFERFFFVDCIGGRTSMNSMMLHYDHGPGHKDRVTGDLVDVSLVVPSTTLIASFCTLSSFSSFVYGIVHVVSPVHSQ